MKHWNRYLALLLTAIVACASFSLPVSADAAVGDTIAIMGEDLTDDEEKSLLEEFGVTEDTTVLYITNAEEHEALGDLIPAAQIGTRAISSVMITYKEPGSGISIQMSHITYITPQSYADALTTLGISDAHIVVSAPYDVSGTAALTGIMKGFEALTGETIDEEIKDAVNEEALLSIDLTEEIANSLSGENAEEIVSNIISDIKVAISEQNPQTDNDIEAIIRDVLEKHGITLSDDLFNRLVDLFNRMKDLDIDWNRVAEVIESGANQLFDLLESEEAKGAFQSFLDWLSEIWSALTSLFS